MSLKTKSVENTEVLDLAALAVDAAAREGKTIAVDLEARRLLDARPNCQISFEVLRDTIARLALARGVEVDFRLRGSASV